MSTATTKPIRHALGLPAGSVRALLALGVLAYLWILVLRPPTAEAEPEIKERAALTFVYMQVLMMLLLAHFFTAHGRSIGSTVSKRSPLGFPSGSIRFLLLAGYLGLAYFMYVNKPPFQVPETGPLMLMMTVLLTCFLVGHFLTKIITWLAGGTIPAWTQDVQAWISLIGLVLLGILIIFRMVINVSLPLEKQIDLDVLESVLAGIIGFYFGARS